MLCNSSDGVSRVRGDVVMRLNLRACSPTPPFDQIDLIDNTIFWCNATSKVLTDLILNVAMSAKLGKINTGFSKSGVFNAKF